MNVYDYSVQDREGKQVDLSEYKGKVLLIVNTATQCGFTPQYTELEKLYETYQGKGFEILDPATSSMDKLPRLSRRSTKSASSSMEPSFLSSER
nr:redoxin domain-containing protein [uncultured Sphaerochaeta sp.]